MRELIAAYEEYIRLLEASESRMLGLAFVHGYRCPREEVKRGAELRTKIAELKSVYEQSASYNDEQERLHGPDLIRER